MARFAFAFASSSIIAVGIAAGVVAGCNPAPGKPIACDTLADGGACVPAPTLAAVRTACSDAITSYCSTSGSGAPDVSCLGSGSTPPRPATPARVTLRGFVRALESGPDTSNITVQVIDPNLLLMGANPAFVQSLGSAGTSLDGAVSCDSGHACKVGACIAGHCWSKQNGVDPLQQACDTDLNLGCSLPLTDGCGGTCNDGLDGRKDAGQYCRDDGSKSGTCRPRLRWIAAYSINNVPTNRVVVIRGTGPGGTANNLWTQVLRWNVLFGTDARSCTSTHDSDCLDTSDPTTPIYRLDLEMISQADWARLPVEAGLPGGVPNGFGAIFGETHDCDDVRVANAFIAVSPAAARISYFAPNPVALEADVTRASIGTDPLGRFAAWSIRAGRVSVDGAALVGGEVTSIGHGDVAIFAGTLDIVQLPTPRE